MMGRKTGGRRPGSKNKLTKQIEQAGARAVAIAAAVPNAFEGDAHAFLVCVYRDPNLPIELRIEAAGKAIRYEKPALAAVDVTSLGEAVRFAVSDIPLTDDEWLEKHGVKH